MKTQSQINWQNQNLQFSDWYLQTYPFLQDFEFPISHENLSDFYIRDMELRNLEPSDVFANEYEFVFSYFLDNYPKLIAGEQRVQGRTLLERVVSSFPGAIDKTFTSDIPDVISDVGTAVFSDIKIIGIILVIIFIIIGVIKFT